MRDRQKILPKHISVSLRFIFRLRPSQVAPKSITNIVSTFVFRIMHRQLLYGYRDIGISIADEQAKTGAELAISVILQDIGTRTHIHNCSLQYFSQNYNLVSCNTYVYMSGRTYSVKSTPNNRFLRNFSWQIIFYTQSFFQKFDLRQTLKKYVFIFRLVGDIWPGF